MEPLGALLKHPEEETRIVAIEALGEIGTPRCLEQIAPCLEDPVEGVRKIAAYWQEAGNKQEECV